MTDEPNLAELQEALKRATAVHIDAKRIEEIARSTTMAALDAVNQAQRDLDVAIELLREDAQHETNWADARKRRVAAEQLAHTEGD